jgi:predicted nucleic acid-binding protein
MAWCFESETSPYSEGILERVRDEGAITSSVWPLEVANTLLVAERSGRSSAEHSLGFSRLLAELPIRVVAAQAADIVEVVLALGREYGLSAYDATYLRLAMKEGLPLSTLDKRLTRACGRAGVALVSSTTTPGTYP